MRIDERNGTRVLILAGEGPAVSTPDDAADLVGDIAEHVEASRSLRDFVWESNRGTQVWFVPDEASLAAKLG